MGRRKAVGAAMVTMFAAGLAVAGCSSSSAPTSPVSTATSTAGSTAPETAPTASGATSTPPGASASTSSSAGPAPVSSPVPGPEPATKRSPKRPAGLPRIDRELCFNASGGSVTGVIEGSIFGASSYEDQLGGLDGAYGAAMVELPDAQKAYRAFIAAGYPRSYVAVQDLSKQISALQALGRAYAAHDLAAVPGIYIRLSEADDQFNKDAYSNVCTY